MQNLILHRKVCNHPFFVAADFRDKQIASYLDKKSKEELRGYE